MPPSPAPPSRAARKSLYARMLLWFFRRAEYREIMGVRVAIYASKEDAAEAYTRITDAFELLRLYGRRSLAELRNGAEGIFVWATAGVLAEWVGEARLVVLEETFVVDRGTSSRALACALVHEASHIRLDRLGVAYVPERRERVERICFRRERRFARRLPQADDLLASIEHQLTRSPEYLSDEAFRLRIAGKLRELGVPGWIVWVLERVSRGGLDKPGRLL